MRVRPLLAAVERRLRMRNLVFALAAGADARSRLEIRRLDASEDRRTLVPVRLRPLGGHEVLVRPRTSDAKTLYESFAKRYHLPPPEAGDDLRVILDLGANIGLTVAHLAHLHPAARVVGVEMDAEAAGLAERNVRPWADRAQIRHAAVWVAPGTVRYRGVPGREHGYRVEAIAYETDRPVGEAPAVLLDELVRDAGGEVDYLKMDVEGTEASLLEADGTWAAAVRAIKVEVHEPYTAERCERRLRDLGFRVRRDPRHPACVLGIRPR